MLRFPFPAIAFREVGDEEVGSFSCEEFAEDGADHERGAQTSANRSGFQVKEMRVYGCEGKSRKYIDESPAPGIIPEWEEDRWIS